MTKRGSKKRADGEGTLRYSKTHKLWEWRTPPSCPVQKSLWARTCDEVLEKKARFLKDLDRGVTFEAEKVIVGEYITSWLTDTVRVNVRRPTYESYWRLAHNHILPTLGKIKLRKLTASHIQTLHAAKFDAGYALKTRRDIHRLLKTALKQAVLWGYIPANPAAAVVIPKGETDSDILDLDYEDLPDPDMRVLDEGQARIFLKAATADRLSALYVLALATGMRQGEMLALDREKHLDLRRGIVRVRRSLALVKGGYVFTPPKTRRSKRDIELRPEAVDALRRHLQRQREERMFYGSRWRDQGLVFSSTTGTPLRRQNIHDRSFKPLLRGAGLPDIRFHDLRHTAATLMLQRGANIKTVSEMLGHSSVRITLDIYAHVLPGMQEEALKTLDGIFA
jgi:integrase